MQKYRMLFVIGLLLLFFVSPTQVNAIDYIDDECINNKTCMVVCSYVTEHKSAGGDNYGPRYITIYYNFENSIENWKLKWHAYTGSTDSSGKIGYGVYYKGFDPFSYVFSDSSSSDRRYSIYIPQRYDSDNFTCPSNAYLDFSSLNSFNEVCFDNNGSWCKEDKSNIGTDFEEASDKVYDFSDEIENYFDSWYNGSIASSLTCDSIYDGSVDNVYSTVFGHFNSNLSKNFVLNGASGDKIPSFVINSPGWNNVSDKVENYVYEVTNKCRNETNQAYENGQISAEERDNRLNQISSYEENIKSTAELNTDPRTNNATTNNWNKVIQCEDIFTNDPGSVGWMLNTIFNYIKVIGPILVVLLSSLDFIKAVLGTDEKAMKEAQSKLIIRLVAAVALFLIPTLVQLLLSFINQTYCSFI